MAGVILSSSKNPRVKAAAALRDRRARDETGLTLIDGVRELSRAISGGVQLVEVFVDETGLSFDGAAAIRSARDAGAAIVPASPGVVAHLAYGGRSEGLVAVVRIPRTDIDRLAPPPAPLVVVVEAIEKPGNLGAILRSADATGADAVIAADPRTDLFNPNAIRASLGTLFAVHVAAGSSAEVRDWLRNRSIRVVTARVDGSTPYSEADLTGSLAIVLGSEAEGLTGTWTGDDVVAVRLPMLGVADSLNVSIAAGVLLYEARRQRGA